MFGVGKVTSIFKRVAYISHYAGTRVKIMLEILDFKISYIDLL